MWWMLAACSQDCGDGFIEKDGLCYAEQEQEEVIYDPFTIDNIMDSLVPCTVSQGDGDLDLLGQCIGSVCVGQPYEDMVAAFGPPEDLTPSFADSTTMHVDWSNGVSSLLPDIDLDGQVDPGAILDWFFLYPPYAGSMPGGQGIGAEVSCFVGLSPVDYININTYEGSETITFTFEHFGVTTTDGVLASSLSMHD